MRTLALAEVVGDQGGQVAFASRDLPASLRRRILDEKIEIHNLAETPGSPGDSSLTAQLAKAIGADWIVVDGYDFGIAYCEALKASESKILVLVDGSDITIPPCDILLNQNISANFPASPPAWAVQIRFLLGIRYALIRREFRTIARSTKGPSIRGCRVLATFGGADPENLSARFAEAFEKLTAADLEAVVLIGSSNPRAEDLKRRYTDRRLRWVEATDTMAAWLSWADVAVSAAGSTSWEIALMGIPSLLIATADNQVPIAEGLHRRRAAESLGWHAGVTTSTIAERLTDLLADSESRHEMAASAQALVDGKGAVRVYRAMAQKLLSLRAATREDCWLLWEWANDPTVRSMSFNSKSISREAHLAWFEQKFDDARCHFFIAENEEGTPVGQIRIDAKPPYEAEINLSIAARFRAMGYGTEIIRMGTEAYFEGTDAVEIDAFVKPENLSSVRAFESAGFEPVEVDQSRPGALHYRRQRIRVPELLKDKP